MNKREVSTWIAFLGGLTIVAFAVTVIAAIWIEDSKLIGKLCLTEVSSIMFLTLFYIIADHLEANRW